MSVLTRSCWMKRLGIGTLALLGMGAVSLQSTPADARVFVDVGGPAVGYIAPPPYYPYAYPAYYRYGYPHYGGVFVGFGGHHHW